jgi:hypothetical protein
MANCEILTWYGTAVLIICGLFILVPYWRGKAELISGWNFFLLGCGIFIGVGCFEAATTPMRFPGLEWFEPTRAEVNHWLTYTTAFLVVLFLAYYFDPFSRRVAAKTFNKWPPLTTPMFLFVIGVCMVIILAANVPAFKSIPFVSQVLWNLSHKAYIFATCFSFVLWYRNRTNVIWLGMFIAIFLAMCVLSMTSGAGRRLLLSVLIVPILVVYFYQARHWRPSRSLAIVGIGAITLFTINLMYSSIRHFDRRGEKQERNALNVIEQVKHVGERDWYARFAKEKLWHFSQQVVHYGMITERFITLDRLEPKPFNTFKFYLAYPIPRVLWANKPVSLGRVITKEVQNRNTSWGTGVAGHAAYEGGVIIAIMFGYFAAFGLRFFVDPITRQPENPFLIAMLAAASSQLVAWTRGDLSVMTFETVECIVFVIAASITCRIVFGTAPVTPAARSNVMRVPLVYRAPAR